MCCFSGQVRVKGTNIFARSTSDGRQLLAYSATLSASEELAMVLPLPTPPSPAEDAVRFIDLSGYPRLFEDLTGGFPELMPKGGGRSRGLASPRSLLKVARVGAFNASFVPTLADFARLDPKFQLPAGTWESLPAYQEHSFAVFALHAGEQDLHPIGFEFPRKDPQKLFFPTVHIHDGLVHPTARFDHTLFLQKMPGERPSLTGWRESRWAAGRFVDLDRACELVVNLHCFRRPLRGNLPNTDIYV